MKLKTILTIALLGCLTGSFGQQTSKWDKFNWLIGTWKGEGSGQPGQGSGTFSFKFDLNNNIVVRRSHSEYPSAEAKSPVVHDDLLIVYPDPANNPCKAIYFDNEGHIINYQITYSDNSIILTSEKVPDKPVFRLIYAILDNQTCNTSFEMSSDGEQFSPYIEGKSIKTE